MRLLRARDWIWLLATPFYVVLAAFRHEGSHALVAAYLGAEIDQFRYWPRLTTTGIVGGGSVVFDRYMPWVVATAPYLLDLFLFILIFSICLRVRFRGRSLWLNLIIVGIVSAFINSSGNYLVGLRGFGDVGTLFNRLPSALVNSYFISTLTAYTAGFFIVLAFGRSARLHGTVAATMAPSPGPPASSGLRAAIRSAKGIP